MKLDSRQTARRLSEAPPHAVVHMLLNTGHIPPDRIATIQDFLLATQSDQADISDRGTVFVPH